MVDALLALRWRVGDEALLDCIDLARFINPPCEISTAWLMQHWSCSQSTVSRRLSRLWEADLLDYRASRGHYRIRSLGPIATECERPDA